MFADDIAAAINKPADFGKKGRHGDTSGRPLGMDISTVYSLVYRGNSRPMKALSASDGMCPPPIQARSEREGMRPRLARCPSWPQVFNLSVSPAYRPRLGPISMTSSTPSAAAPPRRIAIIQRPVSGPHFHVPHMRPSPS